MTDYQRTDSIQPNHTREGSRTTEDGGYTYVPSDVLGRIDRDGYLKGWRVA